MAKTNRGKGIKSILNRGRGKCPSCGSTGIKLLYEHEIKEAKVNVCKVCHAKIKNQES